MATKIAPKNMEDFLDKAAELSRARDRLSHKYTVLQQHLDRITNGHMPAIREEARQVSALHAVLQAMIEARPDLFEKPRTVTHEGIRFGLVKQKGKLVWEDDAKVCARIKELQLQGVLTEEQASLAINVTEKPAAAALASLDARILKRLGVQVTADTDAPLIKNQDSEVEKAVNALIKSITGDANAEVSA